MKFIFVLYKANCPFDLRAGVNLVCSREIMPSWMKLTKIENIPLLQNNKAPATVEQIDYFPYPPRHTRYLRKHF